eukprot:Sdes_comp19323_c0_seq1m10478
MRLEEQTILPKVFLHLQKTPPVGVLQSYHGRILDGFSQYHLLPFPINIICRCITIHTNHQEQKSQLRKQEKAESLREEKLKTMCEYEADGKQPTLEKIPNLKEEAGILTKDSFE